MGEALNPALLTAARIAFGSAPLGISLTESLFFEKSMLAERTPDSFSTSVLIGAVQASQSMPSTLKASVASPGVANTGKTIP